MPDNGAPEALCPGGEDLPRGGGIPRRPGEDKGTPREPPVVHDEREGAERDPGGGENDLPDLPPPLRGRYREAEEEEPGGERRAEFRPGKRRPPDGDKRHSEVEDVLPREIEGEAVERDGEEEGDERVVLGVPRPEEVRGAADRRGEPEEPPPVGAEDFAEDQEGDDGEEGEGDAVCKDDRGDLGVDAHVVGVHPPHEPELPVERGVEDEEHPP
ncbi:hypothetical protein DSECCO2_505510 [anaerobic digester metagenome]